MRTGTKSLVEVHAHGLKHPEALQDVLPPQRTPLFILLIDGDLGSLSRLRGQLAQLAQAREASRDITLLRSILSH